MWRPEAGRAAARLRGVFDDVYLDLVRAQRVYGDWWDEHPEAHPALPVPAGPAAGAGTGAGAGPGEGGGSRNPREGD